MNPYWSAIAKKSPPPLVIDDPIQAQGFAAATRKLTPTILNLPPDVLKAGQKLASVEGVSLDEFIAALLRAQITGTTNPRRDEEGEG